MQGRPLSRVQGGQDRPGLQQHGQRSLGKQPVAILGWEQKRRPGHKELILSGEGLGNHGGGGEWGGDGARGGAWVRRVSWSVRVTNCSASATNRL